MAKRPSNGEILGWALAGAVFGLLAGFGAAATIGRGAPTRVRRAVAQWRGNGGPLPTLAGTQERIEAALAAGALDQYGISASAIRPGVVQLKGWVPTRLIRARAARIAAQVPGIERVVNGLLVTGEDDKGHGTKRRLKDQTA